jgi:hypothetical protein
MTDPNLHRRWRKRLPDFYLQELDKLKMHYDGLDGMAKEADAIGGRLIDGTNRIAASEMHRKRSTRRLTLEIEKDKRR